MYTVYYEDLSGAKVAIGDVRDRLSEGTSAFLVNEPEDLAAVPMKVLVDLYNRANSDATAIKKFQDRSTAHRRLWSFLRVLGREQIDPTTRPSRTRTDLTRTITVLVDGNPKRSGSAAHARFALYKTGMSVKEFVHAGGTTTDVRWDENRNYIRTEEPVT